MKLKIADELKQKLPLFSIIAYVMKLSDGVIATEKTMDVTNYLTTFSKERMNNYPQEEICQIEKIKETRDAYKKLGKDPSHTRPSCEALLRRVNNGKGLYQLGDAIDLGNVLSVETMRSVCVVDLDKIVGDVLIREGSPTEEYYGIGRGKINVGQIPVYVDEVSSFGCVTSDTLRTMVTSQTRNLLVMILCFSKNDLEKDESRLKEIYTMFHTCTNLVKVEQI